MNKKTFYITTPIYYPSGNLHIGHAYCTTMVDALTRYKRMQGFDTYFLTGSDEHGMKIQRAAEQAGKTPQLYVDELSQKFKDLWSRLLISNDQFIRTTDEKHKLAVQQIFKKIYEQGDIYLSAYEGHYCTSCETYFTEIQLAENECCPDCGKKTEILKEESYFFKMSKYAEPLLQHIESNPDFIKPDSRRNEMISFIRQGLDDLCISRTTFSWGIPVPIKDNHVIYVWLDALTNYISALGWNTQDDSNYQKFWPADIHMVGKDIARFHAIIWPTILMAAKIPLPKQIFAHGWLLVGGGKMSKSKGNVVDPHILIDKYGVDAIRYFLLRDISTGQDSNYSEEALLKRINTDLANDFGNLVSRTIAMIEKYFDGNIQPANTITPLDQSLQDLALKTANDASERLDVLDFPGALECIWKLISRANKYIDETTPWLLAKNQSDMPRLATVLYHLSESIRIVTTLLSPFMPTVPERCGKQLGFDFSNAKWEDATIWGLITVGTHVTKGDSLFPRIDDKTLDNPTEAILTKTSATEDNTAQTSEIEFDDFSKLDLRVALITNCTVVPKADKLLQFTLDLGTEKRTVISGIRSFYPTPEELIGKKVVLLTNLKPKKIRGVLSHGMLMTAAPKDDSVLELLTVSEHMPIGSIIS